MRWGWGAMGCKVGLGGKGRPQFLPPPPAEVLVMPPGPGGPGEPYPDKVDEGVVDVGAAGQEEAAAGAELVEEEKLLLLWWGGGERALLGGCWGPPSNAHQPPQHGAYPADAAVVPQSGLILRLLPVGQALGAGEGDGGNALQRPAAPSPLPERCRALPWVGSRGVNQWGSDAWVSPPPLPHISTHRQDTEGGNQPCVPEEGAAAELEEGAAPAGTDEGTWGWMRGHHSPPPTQMSVPPPPQSLPCSPIDSGHGGRHLLLDLLQLEAVVLGTTTQR